MRLGAVFVRERGGERERIELCGELAARCGARLWRYRRLDGRGGGLIADADLATGWRRQAPPEPPE